MQWGKDDITLKLSVDLEIETTIFSLGYLHLLLHFFAIYLGWKRWRLAEDQTSSVSWSELTHLALVQSRITDHGSTGKQRLTGSFRNSTSPRQMREPRRRGEYQIQYAIKFWFPIILVQNLPETRDKKF
jgi:hypothetical protein